MIGLKGLRRRANRSLKRHGPWGTFVRAMKEPFFAVWAYRPSRLRWLREDKKFDKEFGVDTTGSILLSSLDIEGENWKYGVAYEPTDPKSFCAVLGNLRINYERFVFIDLGSGKGRALLMAAEFPFKEIVGIELSRQLHQVAQRNIRSYKNPAMRCTALRSICADAATYRIPYEPAVV